MCLTYFSQRDLPMSKDLPAVFRLLHARQSELLVLPNAWDVCSAKIIESLGALAVATTSAGVAWSQGYTDGGGLLMERQIDLGRALVRAVSIPVSMDVEAGYSDSPAAVAENLLPLFDAGISGINIEDGDDPPSLLASKLEAIKTSLASHGLDAFINVRTDVYLRDLYPDDQKVEMVLTREQLYRAAGADGLFVPGLVEPDQVRTIAAQAVLPLNVMAVPGLGSTEELTALGVRRLSAGSALALCAWRRTMELAGEFLRTGRSDTLTDALSYGDLQTLFG